MATQGIGKLSRSIRRSALSIALGICVVAGVKAQSAVGSIFGIVQPGSSITIQSPQTGLTRSITAGADGRFTFSQLPPGNYSITADGQTRNVVVKVGSGSQVVFGGSSATNLDGIKVVGARAFNPIDVSSVESTSVFTAGQIAALPVGSDVTSVALLAPGAVKGDSSFGHLASFGGSSVAENGYYLNGFDVTNMRDLLSFVSPPFQSIEQIQVKTGGYSAEYGRSMGGIVSMVTKSGSNEFHYGASAEWSPPWGRARGKDVIDRDPNASHPLYVYRSDNESEDLMYTLYASGPIVKDRLFFFAAAEGRDNSSDSFGSLTSSKQRETDPQALLKLDWHITDHQLLEFTGLYNKQKTKYRTYQYDVTADGKRRYNVGRHELPIEQYEMENGGKLGILKYTAYVNDKFTVSAQYGYLSKIINSRLPLNPPGSECPWAYSFGLTTSVVDRYIGCNPGTVAFVSDPNAEPDEDIRKAYRIDAEWVLGDHRLRFGIDRERYTSSSQGMTYAGGVNWAYYIVPSDSVATGVYAGRPGRTVNGQLVAPGEMYARSRVNLNSSFSYENLNSAVYLEDNWQIADNLLLQLGVRGEKFTNKNGDGIAWVESNYKIAPRLGFVWDVTGDSTFKLFGTAGRYYIPVPTNSSIRATGIESIVSSWYYVDGWSEADGTPTGRGGPDRTGPDQRLARCPESGFYGVDQSVPDVPRRIHLWWSGAAD